MLSVIEDRIVEILTDKPSALLAAQALIHQMPDPYTVYVKGEVSAYLPE